MKDQIPAEPIIEPNLPIVDAHAMYRAGGPAAMKSVGEVEFVNGIAAMAASRTFGEVSVCAGIVGNVDLSQYSHPGIHDCGENGRPDPRGLSQVTALRS